MAGQQHSPMPETDAEAGILQYNRELRAAEARNRLDVDGEGEPRGAGASNPVVALLVRISRLWRTPPARSG